MADPTTAAFEHEDSLLGAESALVAALARLLAARETTQVQERIVQALAALVGCDRAALYLCGRRNELRPAAAFPGEGGDALASGDGGGRAAARALAEQRPLLVGGGSETPAGRGAAGGALLALPLRAEGRPLGALELHRHGAGARFTPAERERALGFASLAALVLRRAWREAALAEQARRDALTGLYNHRHCHRLLGELLRRRGASFALLMLDLDDLKLVNDRHGHLRGDELLRAVGRALRRAIRHGDLAFRIGGDEFLLLLPGAGEAQALRLLARIERELPPLPGLPPLGFSYGIAVAPADGESPDRLLSCVDARLYEHKRKRKNASQPAIIR